MKNLERDTADTARRLGIRFDELDSVAAQRVRDGAMERFCTRGTTGFIFDALESVVSRQLERGYEFVPAVAGEGPVHLFFDASESTSVFRFDSAADWVSVFEEADREPDVYLVDPELTWLVAYNHHAVLMAAGDAKERLEEHIPPRVCAECGRPWLDAAEFWRAAVAVGDEDSEEEGEAVVLCPECAEREFGRS